MIEPKFGHQSVFCNGKLYVLGGYSSPQMTQKLQTVYKYDSDLNRWFICNPMKFSRADFSCFSSQNSKMLYVFGGCDNPDNSKTVERYDTVMDVWITLT